MQIYFEIESLKVLVSLEFSESWISRILHIRITRKEEEEYEEEDDDDDEEEEEKNGEGECRRRRTTALN